MVATAPRPRAALVMAPRRAASSPRFPDLPPADAPADLARRRRPADAGRAGRAARCSALGVQRRARPDRGRGHRDGRRRRGARVLGRPDDAWRAFARGDRARLPSAPDVHRGEALPRPGRRDAAHRRRRRRRWGSRWTQLAAARPRAVRAPPSTPASRGRAVGHGALRHRRLLDARVAVERADRHGPAARATSASAASRSPTTSPRRPSPPQPVPDAAVGALQRRGGHALHLGPARATRRPPTTPC